MTRSGASRRPIARRMQLSLFVVGALCTAVAAGVFYALWSQQTLSLRVTELERQVGVIASGVAVADILPGSVEDTGQVRARLLRVEAGIIGVRLAVTDASGNVLYSTAATAGARAYPLARLDRAGTAFDARSAVLDSDGHRPHRDRGGAGVVLRAGPARPLPRRRTAAQRHGERRPLGARDHRRRRARGGAPRRRFSGRGSDAASPVRSSGSPRGRGRSRPAIGDARCPWKATTRSRRWPERSTTCRRASADAYRAQQEFVGDVSHELRTPITSIRGFADAIRDGTDRTMRTACDARRASSARRRTASPISPRPCSRSRTSTRVPWSWPASGWTWTPGGRPRCRGSRRAAASAGVALAVEPGDGAPLADGDRAAAGRLDLGRQRAAPRAFAAGTCASERAPSAGRWRIEVEDDGPGIARGDRERVVRALHAARLLAQLRERRLRAGAGHLPSPRRTDGRPRVGRFVRGATAARGSPSSCRAREVRFRARTRLNANSTRPPTRAQRGATIVRSAGRRRGPTRRPKESMAHEDRRGRCSRGCWRWLSSPRWRSRPQRTLCRGWAPASARRGPRPTRAVPRIQQQRLDAAQSSASRWCWPTASSVSTSSTDRADHADHSRSRVWPTGSRRPAAT